jgi:hypothetical protein
MQLSWIKIFECLVSRAQAQCRAAMTLNGSQVLIWLIKGFEYFMNSVLDVHSLEH